MNLNPIILSIPIYFLLIGIEVLIEKIQQKKLYRFNDAITNISCGITSQIAGIFMKVVVVGIYQFIYENFALFKIPNSWLTFIILFVAVDFCYYWAHRMSHEINLFWGGHVVHHQSEEYNFSVALRQGSFQGLFTFSFNLPLALIGFETETFVYVSALVTVYQFWIHTETIGKLGFLEYFLNTPSHHRVHHGRNPKYIDKNHAGVFIIWDKMFGTFQKEEEQPTYGITTPVNSWNPVWVNFDHFGKIWRQVNQVKSWKDRWNTLFNKPGWQPHYLGGTLTVDEIDKSSYKKYDTPTDFRINLYILFQYVILLGGTAFFLFTQEKLDILPKICFSILIIWAVLGLGFLFEQKKYAFTAELVRLVVSPLILLQVLPFTQVLFLSNLAFISVSVLSLLLIYLKKRKGAVAMG